jgi:protein-disulfide isomerase
MAFARTARLLLLVAPLALGLAACDNKADGTGGAAPSGPIAKVPAPAGTSWAEKVTVTPEGGYLMGNPDAPIKLVEFGALSCSHCAEFSEKSFVKLRDDYVASGRVSFELRFFMLNALDVPAVLLATCGAPEATIPLSELFWGYQRTMFENLNANAALMQAADQQKPPQRFATIAQAGGMDQFFAQRGIAADQAKTCLADVAKAEKLVAQTESASKEFEITGTPTFLLNGSKVEGNTWEAIEPLLQNAGAR